MNALIHIVIQLAAGALGGLGAGKVLPKMSLGSLGDIVAGLVGGAGGAQLLGLLGIGASGSMDVVGILTSILGGGVGGGALMAIVAVVKKLLAKK